MRRNNFFTYCVLVALECLWLYAVIHLLTQRIDSHSKSNAAYCLSATDGSTAADLALPQIKPITTYRHNLRSGTHVSAASEALPTYAMQSTGYKVRPLVTFSSARVVEVGGGGGELSYGGGTTSSSGSRGITYSAVSATAAQVHTIATSASALRGGVTTADTHERLSAPGRRNTPGVGGIPGCSGCVDADGDGVCDRCGCSIYDGCDCCGSHCGCPLDSGWEVVFFMALLAGGYALYCRRSWYSTSLKDNTRHRI